MIVTVLGGSACSTPWLVEWLGQQRLEANITIRLAGRTLYRLAAVARACSLLAEGSLVRIERFEAREWESALSGADLVLIQVRVGGLEARHFDEMFPQPYGIPGDEGLGPGGLAAAVRTWPELRELLDLIFTHAPRSLPILLTSPGNLLIRAAAREFPGRLLYGICELPFTTLERLCVLCGTRVEEVRFSYAGVNHLGWLYKVKCGDWDLIERYSSMRDLPFAELAREYSALPLKYARLHFEQAAVVRERRRADARSRRLMALQERALLAFNYGGLDEIRSALAAREAPWYTAAVGPLLIELQRCKMPRGEMTGGDAERPYFISMADSDGEVRECGCFFTDGDFTPVAIEEPPPLVKKFVDEFVAYERMAMTAVLEPDAARLAQALAAHPWVKSRGNARGLANEIWNDFENRTLRRNELACLS